MSMWIRKRIDIGWADLATGIFGCLRRGGGPTAQRQIEQLWSADGKALACLSVRSGFDLLLGALAWPPGSEVLVSAMTIPDMVRILQEHGLVPVPVDLAIETMSPQLEQLQRAITPATQAILVAHLFGSRLPLEPILELARRHGLMVLEDCAQAFAGRQYLGHPEADVSMYSFGPIKTASALGGAVLQVRDGALLAKMRAAQEGLPVQGHWTYLRRLLKYAMLRAVSPRLPCAMVVGVCRMIGHDYDRMINGSVRSFPGPMFLDRIRHQPSPALLTVLLRRLQSYDMRRVERRTANGRWLAEALREQVPCPGAEVAAHSHWVFPILCDDPLGLVAVLREAGFDATQGQSLYVVPAPADRPQLQSPAARQALAKIVFLPMYPELPAAEVRRMAEVVLQSAGQATPALTTTARAFPVG